MGNPMWTKARTGGRAFRSPYNILRSQNSLILPPSVIHFLPPLTNTFNYVIHLVWASSLPSLRAHRVALVPSGNEMLSLCQTGLLP